MRVVFMGTPSPAASILQAVTREHDVTQVYTRPDRAAGRGLRPGHSPVKQAAQELGLTVHQPATLKDPAEADRLAGTAPDVVVVVAYGQILPPAVLAVPPLGCVNVHFSLLPRWRGAAPVERAIMAGDATTGVTTMLMDEGLDTGPVLLTVSEPIRAEDTGGSLLARLTALGGALLLDTLRGLGDGTLQAAPQPPDGATYAKKLGPEDAVLDFGRPAARLHDQVRALADNGGAYTWFRGARIKIRSTLVAPGSGEPGRIVDPVQLCVGTGDGVLRLVGVQPEGKRDMAAADFVNGYRPREGELLGEEPPAPGPAGRDV